MFSRAQVRRSCQYYRLERKVLRPEHGQPVLPQFAWVNSSPLNVNATSGGLFIPCTHTLLNPCTRQRDLPSPLTQPTPATTATRSTRPRQRALHQRRLCALHDRGRLHGRGQLGLAAAVGLGHATAQASRGLGRELVPSIHVLPLVEVRVLNQCVCKHTHTHTTGEQQPLNHPHATAAARDAVPR